MGLARNCLEILRSRQNPSAELAFDTLTDTLFPYTTLFRSVATVGRHAVDDDVLVILVGEIPLNSFVGAVRITDQDRETLLDHGVDAGLDLGAEARQLAGSGDEDLCQDRKSTRLNSSH